MRLSFKVHYLSRETTLGSEINVGSGINVGVGRFLKNNKRRVWNNSRGGKYITHKGTYTSANFLVQNC